MGSHFGVGEFTTHFRTYFSGDWDVHWGYGFEPWPWDFIPVGKANSEEVKRPLATYQLGRSSRLDWSIQFEREFGTSNMAVVFFSVSHKANLRRGGFCSGERKH